MPQVAVTERFSVLREGESQAGFWVMPTAPLWLHSGPLATSVKIFNQLLPLAFASSMSQPHTWDKLFLNTFGSFRPKEDSQTKQNPRRAGRENAPYMERACGPRFRSGVAKRLWSILIMSTLHVLMSILCSSSSEKQLRRRENKI